MPDFQIRPALPSEAERLTALALRSKAHWGYSASFMDACRAELTLTAATIEAQFVQVATDATALAGFVGLSLEGGSDEAELDWLFVEPAFMGRGLGKALWTAAVAEAARNAVLTIRILSDPGAEPFYLKLGAQRIGIGRSSLRELPLLEYRVG